jgi:UDP-glucose 6-dehydrogenase
MQKIRLHFTLVGKSDAWRRKMKSEDIIKYNVADDVAYVKDTVANQFGNRTTVVANDRAMEHWGSCPKFYAAGWFIDDDTHPSDLVIVGYGNTMQDANDLMMECVQIVDWFNMANKI